MTARAEELAIKKLPALESEAIRWIDNAVEKGWQGIYDPGANDRKKPGSVIVTQNMDPKAY
jgi:hypothetical protein